MATEGDDAEGTIADLVQRFANHLGGLAGFAGQQLTDFQTAANATIASLTQNSELNRPVLS